MKRVLFDARQGQWRTGIGQYTHELTHAFAKLAPDRVRPVAWRHQISELKALGLRPVLDIRRRVEREWLLPSVDVAHGPNFKAMHRKGAGQAITVHDVAWRHLPDFYPSDVRAELDRRVADAAGSGVFAICDSEATRRDLVGLFSYPPERTATVHLGVDSSYATSTLGATGIVRSLGLERPYLLHVGAWVPRKDIPTLLAAWALLADERSDLDVVLVGSVAEGWLSDAARIEAWLREHPGLVPRVKILGYVPESQMAALTGCATAVVSSSRCEGFGLVTLQAMMAGTPVAAMRNSSIPEVCGDFAHYGETGNPESLAEAIREAFACPVERRRAAMDHAGSFTWKRCAEETLACYERV